MHKLNFKSRILISLFSTLLTIAYSTFAATEPNLRGRVMDWNGNGVPNALVNLNGASLQVKTDLSGFFSFNRALPVHKNVVNRSILPAVQLKGRVLSVNSTGSGVSVVVTLFTTSGKKIAEIYNVKSAAGNVTVDISRWVRTAQMVIIQAVIGSERFTIPAISLSSLHLAYSQSRLPAFASSRLLQKNASVPIDSITITHFGYNPVTCLLPVLDTMIDTIKLSYEFRKEADPAGMIRIPGGVFQMGRNVVGNMAYPVHNVFVSPFYMDSTELTQKEYKELTGKEPWLKHEKTVECGVGPEFPAWYVNWNDAVHVCNQRSKKFNLDTVYTWTSVEGELGNNGVLQNVEDHFEKNGYRLPTEAEWEYACRAGTRTTYYWGATADSAISTLYEWSYYNSKPASKSNKVAKLLPNPLMLYDMGGNQFEWCNDLYADYTADFQENPKHALGYLKQNRRVSRSGPHGFSAANFTCTARYSSDPNHTTDDNAITGTRLVLPVKESNN